MDFQQPNVVAAIEALGIDPHSIDTLKITPDTLTYSRTTHPWRTGSSPKDFGHILFDSMGIDSRDVYEVEITGVRREVRALVGERNEDGSKKLLHDSEDSVIGPVTRWVVGNY